MKKIKLLTSVLSLALTASLFTGCSNGSNTGNGTGKDTAKDINSVTPQPTDNPYGLRDNIEDGAILHCFSWSFRTIEETLEDIAMAGYSAIQTSPINACYDGGNAGMDLYGQGKWYYHYQPTDWTIGNYQLGTREEFISLCEAADEYGIKVIVDVAPNHTTTATDAISQDFLDAVGGLDNMYHSDGKTSIVDYTDRTQCTLRAVGGLYDVNTENPDFQDYFIAFLNDCIACGADGFRYDTAKHIGLNDDPQDNKKQKNNFWDRVTTEVDKADELFLYGEVLQDGGERIADYIEEIGATTASAYGERVRASFTTAVMKADLLTDLRIGDAEPNVVTWVESHDNYTGDGTAKTVDNEEIKLAYAFITARAEGTPLFFSRPYGATGDNMWGTFNKIGMAGDNLYKDDVVVAANRFRNAMAGLPENIFNPDKNERVVCLERGTKGLLLINADREEYSFKIQTALEDGTYVNRCDGITEYTVKKGKLTGTLPAKGIMILCNDGFVELAEPASVRVADETTSYIIGDALDVSLVAENTAKATYSINDGESISFADGDVISIGEGAEESEIIKLTLNGENAEGNKTCISYLFKKQGKVMAGTKIYFEKPESWGDKISAYVYDETSYTGVKENSKWPGAAMTVEEDGTYSYTFEEEWIAPLVIFTDGTNQSNGKLEPGAEVLADKLYTVE